MTGRHRPALALVPPPRRRREGRLRREISCARMGGFRRWLRFRLLGDMILCNVAPRRMREAAWREGFAIGRGSARRNWLLDCLDEVSLGCEAAGHLAGRLAVIDPSAWLGRPS